MPSFSTRASINAETNTESLFFPPLSKTGASPPEASTVRERFLTMRARYPVN